MILLSLFALLVLKLLLHNSTYFYTTHIFLVLGSTSSIMPFLYMVLILLFLLVFEFFVLHLNVLKFSLPQMLSLDFSSFAKNLLSMSRAFVPISYCLI